MDNMIDKVREDIWNHFHKGFGLKLTDSPQILKKYLYIEYWGHNQEVKLRITYPIDRRDFLRMPATERNNWIENQILQRIIHTSIADPHF